MSERSPVTDTAAKVGLLLFNLLLGGVLLGDLWGLYSSEPLIPALKGWWPGMTPTFYMWVRVALELSMLGLLAVILFRAHQWKKEERQTPLPPPPPVTSPITPSTSPTLTLALTGAQATDLTNKIKSLDHIIRVKIVSSPEYFSFAKDLEYILSSAGCRIIADTTHHETIFRAQSVHKNNGVVFRYQKNNIDSRLNFTHLILAQTLDAIIIPQLAHTSPITSSLVDLFPPGIIIGYFQIELGGAP